MLLDIKKMLIDKYEYIRMKGTITPSSRHTVNKILNKINFDKDISILQLGFWTGVFTKWILKKLNEKSKLVIFEIDRLCDKYYDDIKDKRVTYIKDSAENVSNYFPKQKFDYILSTLPFAIIKQNVKETIFNEIKNHLNQNGKFLQFQYSLVSKKDIWELFDIEPKIDFSFFNIPPTFIYELQNKLK